MSKRAERIQTLLDRARTLSRSEPAKAYRLSQRALVLAVAGESDVDVYATALRVGLQLAFEQKHLQESARMQSELEALLPQCSALVAARCKNGMGWIAYCRGDLGRALSLTSESLTVLAAAGETEGELWARNNLASVYSSLGSRERAVALYIENRERSRQLGKTLMEGGALLNLAMMHNDRDDFPAALAAAEQSLPLLDACSDLYAQLMARTQIVDALLGLGRLAEAREQCETLLATPCPIPAAAAMLRYYHARVLRHQQAFDEAIAAARQGLSITPRPMSPDKLLLWKELALAHEARGDLTEAWQLIRKVLVGAERLRTEKTLVSAIEVAARVAERRGRFKVALEFHKRLRQKERELISANNEKQRILFAVELALERAEEHAEKAHERNLVLEEAVARDGMTGLYNHAAFQRMLEQHIQDRPLALVMLDVDNFKRYNDTHGHPAGDALLKSLASLLRGQLRDEDRLARYGGEEFALLLPAHDADSALFVAERLRQAVASHRGPHGVVTVSVGVSATPPLPADPGQLVEAADRALYQAKRQGKNQVVVSAGITPS